MSSLTRKEQLEQLKRTPGRESRYWDLWYDLLKNLPTRKKVTIGLATWKIAGVGLTGATGLFSLPAGGEVLSAFAKVTTAFAGGSLSAASLSVGPSTSPTGILKGNAANSTGLKKAIGLDLSAGRAVYNVSAAVGLQARLILTGATFNELTAGSTDFYITYIDHTD